jgi:hypothetical protein
MTWSIGVNIELTTIQNFFVYVKNVARYFERGTQTTSV